MTWLISVSLMCSIALLVAGLREKVDPGLRRALFIGRPAERKGDLLGGIGRRLTMHRARAHIDRRLDGTTDAGAVDRVVGAKAVLAVGGFVLGFMAFSWSVGAFVVSAILGSAGYRLPDFLLARRQAARHARSIAAVPDVLDVVAVCVTAGLTPRVALDRAAVVVEKPLSEELAGVRVAAELGSPWGSALRAAVERTGSAELRRLVRVLERSERLGTPVADRLRDLAR